MLIPGGRYPDDLDTTSLALMVLRPHPDVVTSVLDEMLRYLNSDGTFQVSHKKGSDTFSQCEIRTIDSPDTLLKHMINVQTYFDRTRPRTDPVVSANVLSCFYTFGRGQQLELTLQTIHSALLQRTYIQGTRYYSSADCCLFFFGRLWQSSNDDHLRATLGPLLKERTREQIGKAGSALDLAVRILTCSALDLNCDIDRRTLLDLQREDGSWEIGWMYGYPSIGVKIGNHGVTTALAVKAIASSEKGSQVEQSLAATEVVSCMKV